MARKPDFEVKDTAEALRARGQQVAKQLTELGFQVDQLNHSYLMYFRGQEKREPYKARQKLEGNFRQFKMPTMSTTVLRFKYNQLLQRMVALRSYWDRTCRSIEEGTFKFGHGAIPPAMGTPISGGAPSSESPKSKGASSDTPKSESNAEKPSTPPPTPGEFEALFADYVSACADDNVRTRAPSYEAFEKSLKKQKNATAARVGHDRIRYEVRTKNGEAKVVAVIKKKR